MSSRRYMKEDELKNAVFVSNDVELKTEIGKHTRLIVSTDAEFYEKSEIMHYLNVNKVVAGINESHVMAMCKKKIYEREVKVASKVMGEAGQPGYYEFKFSTEKPKPEIRKDGSVDYRAMSLIQNVEEGDLLAIYHPAVQGTSSRDVTGAFDKSDLYKDLRPLTGKGIAQSDTNPNEYYATKSGKIEYDGENKLSIVEVYEINGGCDLADNAVVEFNGDVIIHVFSKEDRLFYDLERIWKDGKKVLREELE